MSTEETLTKSEVDPQVLSISQAIENAKKSVITPLDLRLALMDYKNRNIPLYTQHLSDEDLWKCIEWGCEHFNEIQPQIATKYTIQNFPRKKMLLDLAVIEALRLTSLIELRGEMQYSDGGVQSTIYYKSAQFSQLRAELEQKVEQQAASIKRAMNINACYGTLC